MRRILRSLVLAASMVLIGAAVRAQTVLRLND
jgi:hypothetical protein